MDTQASSAWQILLNQQLPYKIKNLICCKPEVPLWTQSRVWLKDTSVWLKVTFSDCEEITASASYVSQEIWPSLYNKYPTDLTWNDKSEKALPHHLLAADLSLSSQQWGVWAEDSNRLISPFITHRSVRSKAHRCKTHLNRCYKTAQIIFVCLASTATHMSASKQMLFTDHIFIISRWSV